MPAADPPDGAELSVCWRVHLLPHPTGAGKDYLPLTVKRCDDRDSQVRALLDVFSRAVGVTVASAEEFDQIAELRGPSDSPLAELRQLSLGELLAGGAIYYCPNKRERPETTQDVGTTQPRTAHPPINRVTLRNYVAWLYKLHDELRDLPPGLAFVIAYRNMRLSFPPEKATFSLAEKQIMAEARRAKDGPKSFSPSVEGAKVTSWPALATRVLELAALVQTESLLSGRRVGLEEPETKRLPGTQNGL